MNNFTNHSHIEVYKSIIEHNPDAIFILSINGIIMEVNQAARDWFGYSNEDIQGVSYQELICSTGIDKINPQFNEVLQGSPAEVETCAYHKNGKILEIRVKLIPLIVDEQVVGVCAVVKDFTELLIEKVMEKQKQLETSLKKSELKYRLITDSMTDLVGALDKNGKIIYASPSHERVLGLSPSVYEGNLAFDLVHPDDFSNLKQQFDYMVRTEETIRVEFRLEQVNGNWLWMEVKGNPVYDEQGDLLYFLVVARDISARKRMEQELRLSEERYRLLVENSQDLIQLVNLNGIVTYASPSHKTVLGFDPKEYIGKMVFYQPNGKIDNAFNKAMLSMIEKHEPFTLEIARMHKAGYKVWLELTGMPVYEEDGQLRYLMVVAREMTKRRQYQKKLEFLSTHDTLTGLPNRRFFEKQLKLSINEADRFQRKMAIMFLDLDRFKHINDTFGHDAGDELLKQFTSRVQECIRESDILVRLGGDEFVILLPGIGGEFQVTMIAKRIINSLQTPWNILDHEFKTTTSIGIAFYEQGDRAKEIVKKADIALYQAKLAGRNTFSVYQN